MGVKLFSFLLFASAFSFSSVAQKSPVKFGSVSVKDFSREKYKVDSSSGAVVIVDFGVSSIDGNNKGGWSTLYKRHRRMHILGKNSFDAAEVRIPLYSDGREGISLDKLKAVTYNLENGKVVETKLDVKKDVFEEKIDRNWTIKKFTFPNVKEGSIIEFEYGITSDDPFHLQPWEFQGEYPVLWSEYNMAIPAFAYYLFLTQGDQQFDIQTKDVKREVFAVNDQKTQYKEDITTYETLVTYYRWVKKDVPALKEEAFTSTTQNYISKIEFEFIETRNSNEISKVDVSWPRFTKELLRADYFGFPLTQYNDWLKGDIENITAGATSSFDKAKAIYAFVRDNFTCTSYTEKYLTGTLRETYRGKKGSVADINILLTAMLKYAGITADPVILQTRPYGFTYAASPIRKRLNYVIVRAVVNNRPVYLDATEPLLGFGYLPLRCYNGYARIVNEKADAIDLSTSHIKEVQKAVAFVGGNDGKFSGSIQWNPGYYESHNFRKKIKEKGIGEFRKELVKEKSISEVAVVTNVSVDSLSRYEDVLGIKFAIDFNTSPDNDILYVDPMFVMKYKENPFKSANRLYPVELPYMIDETYSLQLEVPSDYEADELPKSITLKLNEKGDGVFEYRVAHAAGVISVHSRLSIKQTTFAPNDYVNLREFFNVLINKHGEQIVLKKKK